MSDFDQIYGSSLEMALRILLLLSAKTDENYSLNRIIYYDFMVTYGRYFDISTENLHGENDYGFGELARRRKYADLAIRELVLRRFITVEEAEDGFYYHISEEGVKRAASLNSEYAEIYRGCSDIVVSRYQHFSDGDIMRMIDESSKMMLRGGKMYD